MKIKCSFVIGSLYDKNQKLQECIDSIERAYFHHHRDCDIEICIVFYNVIEDRVSLNSKYPQKIKMYYVNIEGHASKRNYAIRRSDADLFIFLDDHAEVKENFLDILTKDCMTTDAEAFCGIILEKDTNRYFTTCFANLKKKKYLCQSEYRYFRGSSHVLKKTALIKTGLYDEEFGLGAVYRAAEESDMFFRLKRQGVKILFQPELVFYHPIQDAVSSSKVVDYSYGTGAMLTKQMIIGSRCFYIYLYIFSGMLSKSFLRILHGLFISSRNLENEGARFYYKDVLWGTVNGAFDYLKRRVYSAGKIIRG